MSEVNNCPLCGKEVQHHLRGNEFTKSRQYEIKCRNCNLVMIVGAIRNGCDWVKEKCIEKWNTRANDEKLAKCVAFINKISLPHHSDIFLKEAQELYDSAIKNIPDVAMGITEHERRIAFEARELLEEIGE